MLTQTLNYGFGAATVWVGPAVFFANPSRANRHNVTLPPNEQAVYTALVNGLTDTASAAAQAAHSAGLDPLAAANVALKTRKAISEGTAPYAIMSDVNTGQLWGKFYNASTKIYKEDTVGKPDYAVANLGVFLAPTPAAVQAYASKFLSKPAIVSEVRAACGAGQSTVNTGPTAVNTGSKSGASTFTTSGRAMFGTASSAAVLSALHITPGSAYDDAAAGIICTVFAPSNAATTSNAAAFNPRPGGGAPPPPPPSETTSENAPVTYKYPPGSVARFNTTRRVWAIYAPPQMAGLGDDSVAVPPPPSGFVKVAEETEQPPGTLPGGNERDRAWYDNKILWIGGGALVLGGGWLLLRKR